MARLGEPFPLGSFHGTIVGVSQCRLESPALADYVTDASQKNKTKDNKNLSDDFVAITVQDSGVHVYNTNDQKCVKSWSVKPGFNFSQPAIQHPKTDAFYAIQGNKTIYSWNLDSGPDKGLTKETGKHLFDVKTSRLFDNLIAVTREGQVGIYDPSLRPVGEFYTPSKKAQREILWAATFDRNTSIHLATFGTEGDLYVLTLFVINPLENTIGRNVTFQVTPQKEELYPIACDFDSSSNKFIVTWSNYVWQLFDIPQKFFSSKREQAVLTASKEIPLAGYEGEVKDYAKTISKRSNLFGKSGFTSSFIQPSFVAFVGMNKSSNTITVWDLKYGTIHAEQSLERNTFEPSQLSDSFRLSTSFLSSSSGGYLVIVDVTTVWASSFSSTPISLMDVIGKMTDTAKHLSPEGANSLLFPPAPAIVKIPPGGDEDIDKWKQIIENDQAKEREAMEILVNPEKSPSEKAFTKEFFKYINTHKPAEEEGSTEGTEDNQTVHISHHFIANIIDRCFSEERFFPAQVLDFMICSKLLSVSETKMLPKLVEKRELGLIEKCLSHIYDIPEPDLVRLLKFFLTDAKEETLKKFVEDKEQSSGSKALLEGDTPRDFFLYLITSAPRNDIFLQTSVRSLTFSEVLLQFLRKMAQRHSENLYKTLIEKVTTRIPTFAQVLDWSSVVIDAHFAQLVLSKEIHPLLKELQSVVAQEVDCCDKMETLPGRLSQFFSKGPLPTKKMGSYCIEILQI